MIQPGGETGVVIATEATEIEIETGTEKETVQVQEAAEETEAESTDHADTQDRHLDHGPDLLRNATEMQRPSEAVLLLRLLLQQRSLVQALRPRAATTTETEIEIDALRPLSRNPRAACPFLLLLRRTKWT